MRGLFRFACQKSNTESFASCKPAMCVTATLKTKAPLAEPSIKAVALPLIPQCGPRQVKVPVDLWPKLAKQVQTFGNFVAHLYFWTMRLSFHAMDPSRSTRNDLDQKKISGMRNMITAHTVSDAGVALDTIVARLNIERFCKMLSYEVDEIKRHTLGRLIAEEKAKLDSLVASPAIQ